MASGSGAELHVVTRHAPRPRLEVLRTDPATLAALVGSRRNRRDDWYQVPAGYVDLCNVPIVVRAR